MYNRGIAKIGLTWLLFYILITSFPDLAGGRTEGEICSSKKIHFFFLLAVTKFERALQKLVRASREFYVFFFIQIRNYFIMGIRRSMLTTRTKFTRCEINPNFIKI